MSQISHNTAQIKKLNVELIKSAIKSKGLVTKASIANLTSLSVATCGSILNELVATGEVVETMPEESSGGRPAKRYKYNADFGCVICLLIRTEGGMNSISYRIVNLLGETIEEETMELERIDIHKIDALIADLMHKYSQTQAVGVGIPGVVHRGVIGVCDVPELAGQPLGSYLKEKYEVSVTVQNDMNMTIYGLYHLQNFQDETFAVVTFPKNHFPGAGFIVDGRILSGNTTFGGEVSFLPFGITREEQLKQLESDEGFLRLAVHTLTSIIAILNPAAIAITGERPRASMLNELYQGCLQNIPEEHMPKLFIKNDTREEYMKGMVTETLESLSYHLQMIEKDH